MSTKSKTIIYTKTDEAPALATYSFLPIVKAFCQQAGITMETRDISLAGRILAQFPERLKPEQKQADHLAELGELCKTPEANIIKLPNISASIPQLKAAIQELQEQGFALPDFPEDPQTEDETSTRQKYAKVLGSAVNPVLREGNSDRRVAKAVKQYAKDNPHSMTAWNKNSKSHVAHMSQGDFYGSEKSAVMDKETTVNIVLEKTDGSKKTLKEGLSLLAGEVIDASLMSHKDLIAFYEKEFADAKQTGILLSLHYKATMMKVSDPILFGAAFNVYFANVIKKHAMTLDKIGFDARNGMGDLLNKIEQLTDSEKASILTDINSCYEQQADLAMVDSDKGITNLHVPSDVIIDASMPAAIRAGGQMWNKNGKLQETKAIIPDRCYAGVYQKTIEFCQQHGAFDPTTMGTVSNVGLMAKKAEEYGSHDKTFWIQDPGTVSVVTSDGQTVFSHKVETGDIWRMCQTKDIAVKDWVKLGVSRARATNSPAVFWLDKNRAHDANLIEKVNTYLKDHDTNQLEIKILPPTEAVSYTLERVKKGDDTISVTGNVLRDYLTDLFPILELGTSAKMLSIVPLLAGGGLFETGAGGSAPKHVQQFNEENHLRWDSLGEFLALAVSLEDLGEKTKDASISALANSLDEANTKFLKNNKSPKRKVGELDTRGSHFYLSYYWAQALAAQETCSQLKATFTKVAQAMESNEGKIVEELNTVQGKEMEIGGYFAPDFNLATQAMRPSATLNQIVDNL